MKLFEKQSQESGDNRAALTTEDRVRTGLFSAIAGVGVVLVIVHAIALFGWQPHRLIVAPPWLFAMVDSWLVFAATCVALFAFGRFRVLRDPVSYWICTGFAAFAIGWVFRILAWPGLLPDGGAIICHLPYTSATIGLWAISMLAIALLLSALGRWPRDKALRGSRGLWSVAGWLAFAVLVNVLMVVFEQSLPALSSARGGWTPFALTWTYLNASMYASSLALSIRRYLLTVDVLPAYTAPAQMTLGLFSFILGLGGRRYDLLTFIDRLLCIPGFWTMAFGLLAEYVHLFRREQAKSRQLRESNERFRQVAENVGDFIWEVDAQGLYRYTSPSVEKILGYAPDELVGKMHFYDLFMPERREELKAAAFQVFAAKQPLRAFPNQNLSKDGRVVHLETSGSPVLDETGNLTGYLGVDADVTERQKLEAHLQQTEKMEALGTLTGGIAHDFNNILAAMTGFTELVKEKLPKGSPDERYLQMVMDAGLRGRELIRQMLTFSRQTPQEKKPLQLSTIVKEISRFLRASIPSTISIRVNVESESGFVLADPVQVQQVLTNLCTNAAHAMQEKGGTLDIGLSDFSVSPSNGEPHGIEPGPYMRLTVRDTGVGIPPEIVDKIFDPFFTTKKVGEGTGLGLSVAMGIVKQSQGYITVQSEPGKGSTFTVYFPKVAEKRVVDAVATDDSIPTGSERILFVDDEKPLVMMGEALLAELGYEVTSRTSSTEALELLKQDASRFDLVITDQTMPEITGVELAREILAIRPELPVILCTGFSHLVNADSAKEAGIKGFVMKPMTKGEIARTLRKVLDG